MPYVPPKYPGAIPTAGDLPDRTDDIDWLYAARYNELKKELRAALIELGVLPKGGHADVKTRLDASDSAAAAHAAATTGVHGLSSLHAAGFHSAGQAVSKVIWKSASERALTLENQTGVVGWTDLDLTAYTSANAKLAILTLLTHLDSYTSGYIFTQVRKNGTAPSINPTVYALNTPESNFYTMAQLIIGMDSNQIIEYRLTVTGTAQVDFYIDVLGYIE